MVGIRLTLSVQTLGPEAKIREVGQCTGADPEGQVIEFRFPTGCP